MTDTTKLDIALDDCNDRLSQAMVILGDMQTRVRELSIERDSLARAKMLVSPQAEPVAPAKPKRAYKRRTESRAAETVPGNPPSERIAVSSLPEATPSDNGAGADTEMPAFLRRNKAEAAE